MMKYVLALILILLFSSCSKYAYQSLEGIDHDSYMSYKFKSKKELGYFNAYNDYLKDTIDFTKIYVTKKELKQIKSAIIPKRSHKMVLFLHNEIDKYLNVYGYFYPNLQTHQIQQPVDAERLTKGWFYRYTQNNRQIADFMINHQQGVLRLIAIENPIAHQVYPYSFQSEIDYLFFTLNAHQFKRIQVVN